MKYSLALPIVARSGYNSLAVHFCHLLYSIEDSSELAFQTIVASQTFRRRLQKSIVPNASRILEQNEVLSCHYFSPRCCRLGRASDSQAYVGLHHFRRPSTKPFIAYRRRYPTSHDQRQQRDRAIRQRGRRC